MKKGVLIVGYGTRTGNLTEVLEGQAAKLRARGYGNVYTAYFRVSSPTIQEALAEMAGDGIDTVLAVPYFIAEGRLTYELIPEKLGIPKCSCGAAEIGGKKMRIYMSSAFGKTRVLTHILCDRIAEAGGTKDSGILVIGHGSRDMMDSNSEIVALNAERLSAIGYRNVVYAFNEFCEPGIEDGMKKLASMNVSEIIIVPLFIAFGVHLNEEIAEKAGIPCYSKGGDAEIGGKKVTVKYMPPVQDDPRLLELIDGKISEFLGE